MTKLSVLHALAARHRLFDDHKVGSPVPFLLPSSSNLRKTNVFNSNYWS